MSKTNTHYTEWSFEETYSFDFQRMTAPDNTHNKWIVDISNGEQYLYEVKVLQSGDSQTMEFTKGEPLANKRRMIIKVIEQELANEPSLDGKKRKTLETYN